MTPVSEVLSVNSSKEDSQNELISQSEDIQLLLCGPELLMKT